MGKLIFIRETQISKTQCIKICKSNNPAEGGGIKFQSLLWDFIPVIAELNRDFENSVY